MNSNNKLKTCLGVSPSKTNRIWTTGQYYNAGNNNIIDESRCKVVTPEINEAILKAFNQVMDERD